MRPPPPAPHHQHGDDHKSPHEQRLLPADHVQEAAFCIKDALDFQVRPHPSPTPWAQWAYRLRIRTLGYLLPWFAIWTLIVLTFVETPTWCLRDPAICDPDSSLSALYPRATARFVGKTAAFVVELVALAVLTADYCLQMVAEGLPLLRLHPLQRGFWHQWLLVASFLSLVVSAALGTRLPVRAGPFLRILFLAAYSRRLRQELKLTVRILPQFGKALVLLCCFMLLYAILGLSLFSPDSADLADAQEASIYFTDFQTAVASTWQLFLYWTFPGIMILKDPETGEYLPPNFVLALFVFSFMIVCIYLLLSLALAIAADGWSDQTKEVDKERKRDRKQSLERAFALLLESSSSTSGSPPPPPPKVPTHVLAPVVTMVCTFSSAPSLTHHGIDAFLAELDPDGHGWVGKAQFMGLPDLLLSADLPDRLRLHDHEAEADLEEQPRFVDLWCPRVSAASWFQAYGRFVKSSLLEWIIDAVIIANLALALAAHGQHGHKAAADDSTGEIHQGRTLLSQQDFSLVAAVIFTCEVASKLLVFGWNTYVSSYMNIFDMVLTVCTIGGAIYELGGWASAKGNQHHTLLVFELLRILRLFRALLSIPQFRTTGKAFVQILPKASSLFLNLFAVTFVFAAVALEAWGGLVNKDPSQPQFALLEPTYFWQNGLLIFNVNDLGGGFIILVMLLIDASLIQPFYEAYGMVVPGQKAFLMAFFVLYYCLGQLVALNIVIAFILDAFMYESSKEDDGEEEKEEEGGEGDGGEAAPLLPGTGARGGGGGGGGDHVVVVSTRSPKG